MRLRVLSCMCWAPISATFGSRKRPFAVVYIIWDETIIDSTTWRAAFHALFLGTQSASFGLEMRMHVFLLRVILACLSERVGCVAQHALGHLECVFRACHLHPIEALLNADIIDGQHT